MRIDNVFTIFLIVTVILMLILSFIWSIYLTIRIVKEKSYLKYLIKMRKTTSQNEWITKIKNSERKLIKTVFLAAICTIEWIIYLSAVSLAIKVSTEYIIKTKHLFIPITHTTNLFKIFEGNLCIRVFVSFFLTFLSLILPLLRILTQYLCQQYSFFSDPSFKLSIKFRRIGVLLLLIFALGIKRQTIIFQWTLVFIYMVYELGCYIKATKTLCNLLSKRYFDAKTHENQLDSVIVYYKKNHLEFLIGSIAIQTSLIIHLVCMVIFIVFSVVYLLTVSPNTWMDVLLMNEKIGSVTDLPQNIQDYISVVSKLTTLFELLLLSIGRCLFLLPYLLVSLKLLSTHLLASLKPNNNYTDPELIKELIQQHYKAYYKCGSTKK